MTLTATSRPSTKSSLQQRAGGAGVTAGGMVLAYTRQKVLLHLVSRRMKPSHSICACAGAAIQSNMALALAVPG